MTSEKKKKMDLTHPFAFTAPPMSVYEILKTVLLSFTLFPIRLVGSILIVFVSWAYAKAIMFIFRMTLQTKAMERGDEPFPWFVRQSLYPVHYMFRGFLFLWGFYWFNIKGNFLKRKDAPVIVANHVSFFEPLLLAVLFKPAVVARAEEKNRPGMGVLFQAVQCLFVDRKDKNSREKIRKAIHNRAMNDSFPHMMLFPEGTTTNNMSLIEFKTGAFSPGVPVQPVIVSFKRNNRWPIQWIPGLSMLYVAWRTGCQFVNYVDVELCPAYKPTKEEQKDPILYANNVRMYFAKKMKTSVKSYNFQDVLITEKGRQIIGFEFTPNMLAREKIKRYGLTIEKTNNPFFDCLGAFTQFNPTNYGQVNKSNFVKTLTDRNIEKDFAQKLYQSMDPKNRGYIEFSEFFDYCHMFNKNASASLLPGKEAFGKIYKSLVEAIPKKQLYARV